MLWWCSEAHEENLQFSKIKEGETVKEQFYLGFPQINKEFLKINKELKVQTINITEIDHLCVHHLLCLEITKEGNIPIL